MFYCWQLRQQCQVHKKVTEIKYLTLINTFFPEQGAIKYYQLHSKITTINLFTEKRNKVDLTNHFGATIRHHREHWESSQQLCRTNPKSSHSVLALQISAEVHHLSFVYQCAVLRSSADKVVFIYHAVRKTDNKHARYVQIMCHVVYIIDFYFLNTFKMLFTMLFRLEFN